MNRALEIFLSESAREMAKTPSIRRFMTLRYDVMVKCFPHKTFSVGQADLDFFGSALAHLRGQPFAGPDSEASEYEANYRAWIRANRA